MESVPSEELLRKAVSHVAHEIRMLEECWKHLANRHAYVGWYVHARTLMHFFRIDCECKGKHDDICAWHFLGTDTVDGKERWRNLLTRLPKPDRYDEYHKAVNKLAAHLTFSRTDYAEKAARGEGFEPSDEVTKYLLGLSMIFLRELPQERLGWFGTLRML